MSYIRMGHPLRFVDGNSEDYIYPTPNDTIYDYGSISDSGFIELLYLYWEDESGLKEHLIKRLAERLNIKLRKKLLSEEEYIKLLYNNDKKEKELGIREKWDKVEKKVNEKKTT